MHLTDVAFIISLFRWHKCKTTGNLSYLKNKLPAHDFIFSDLYPIRDPVGSSVDTNPRDSGPPHFKKKKAARNSLQNFTEVVNSTPVPDDRLLRRLHLQRRRDDFTGDVASLLVRRSGDFEFQLYFCSCSPQRISILL